MIVVDGAFVGSATVENQLMMIAWVGAHACFSLGDDRFAVIALGQFLLAAGFASLSGTDIPRVALPHFDSRGELVRFLLKENLPGYWPFTAGVFPFKRTAEDPTGPGSARIC